MQGDEFYDVDKNVEFRFLFFLFIGDDLRVFFIFMLVNVNFWMRQEYSNKMKCENGKLLIVIRGKR